ncbi:tyrosinase [Laccaria bicolor S238N-H82]|uniref:tyrosinase n=1 Tax=Laccaria bicolor (strain S238N-H82 / ATCC MYA-4686) TaxID=486041 RepID=B0DMA1_LACBS|nr:tyrosinase [Laccaria bicolor S238N-H82]EDR04243.1 tyrosinase [Laccaria bicolor S238N-H82]|eukprot:XP_001885134.1 tyrosinase [Laccaria bicolor S238N-H82]
MSRFVISGPGGGAPNRLEIRTFVQHDKYFSLYIQALQLMYTKESQAALQSFFQVGGIHGLPYIPWDGVTGIPNPTWGGYCTHGSVLFPTWHRPYVSAFEQILWTRAQEVAATYTVDQAAWKAAATTLRQPYWDWAVNSVPPDEVIAKQTVSITGHDGKKKDVANPLYHYTFHPIDPSFPTPYSGWKTTLRQPTSLQPDATDNIARLRLVLKNAQSNIRSNTYNLLTRVTTWPAFSNHTVGDGGSTSNSLEAIHDGIHVYVGGNGQMGDPAVAGFDPIFFLHHCNVDRLLSLWSALHHGVWVTPGPSQRGTLTIPANSTVDTNTNLTPFYHTQTAFWASAGVPDTTKLGYTYPEFNGLDTSNPAAVQKAIAAIVNKLYGSAVFGVQSALVQEPAAAAQQPVAAAAPSAPSADDHHPTIQHAGHGYPRDWTARVEFKKFETGQSFSVLLFLGSVPEKPEEYITSPHFVGAHHAFVNSAASHCQNCQNQAELVEEGFVHLSRGILQYGKLESLDAEVVEPYLTKDLHWRAVKADGITPVEIPSLEVSIFSTPLTYPRGSAFPIAGNTNRHSGITHGRRGGSRELHPGNH